MWRNRRIKKKKLLFLWYNHNTSTDKGKRIHFKFDTNITILSYIVLHTAMLHPQEIQQDKKQGNGGHLLDKIGKTKRRATITLVAEFYGEIPPTVPT